MDWLKLIIEKIVILQLIVHNTNINIKFGTYMY